MKKLVLIFLIANVLTVTGCSKNESAENPETISSADIFGEISENTAPEEETSNIAENIVSTDAASESNETVLDICEDDIINKDGILDNFLTTYQDATGKITVGSYNDLFPVELQDLLIACNSGHDSDIDWEKYTADYDVIAPEDAEDKNVPYEEIIAATERCGKCSDNALLSAFDVDADGNDEYWVNDSVGTGWQVRTMIIKNVESEWVVIGGDVGPNDTSIHRILEYEDRYYLLLGNDLAYWNNEIECPDLSYWERDGILGYDDCWNELETQKKVIGYTPYEIYTGTQGDTTDYLAGIDLETLKPDDAEDVTINNHYLDINDFSFSIKDNWLSNGNELYLYIITDIGIGRNDKSENDRILFTLRQTEEETWEMVKVYYMAADYDIQLNMRRSQTFAGSH